MLVWCLKHPQNAIYLYLFITVQIAGSDDAGFQNGALNVAKFYYPYGIVLNPNHNCLYISDTCNHCIRMINDDSIVNFICWLFILTFSNLEVCTFVGKQGCPGFQNSHGSNAQFNFPQQFIYYERENCFFVADRDNHLIRKITMEGNEDN